METDLSLPEGLPEAEILAYLEQRLTDLLTRQPEAFFQLMYRLDIPEAAMQRALGSHNAPSELAILVYNRQLKKQHTRTQTPNTPDDTDPELKW